MKSRNMRKNNWDGSNINYDAFFPKWVRLQYDQTCTAKGCFEERPGNILFNFHLSDLSNKDDQYINIMNYINTEYLGQEQEYSMRVFIFQACNLPPADDNGLSDPYVNL